MEKSVRQAWNVYFKNACVGAHAIACVMNKTKNAGFRSLLEKQRKEYAGQERRARSAFQQAGERPDTSAVWLARLCAEWGILTHTVCDRSVSNLAGLMVQGTNMGVITLLQTLHDTGSLPDDVLAYGNTVLKRENEYMESLKLYL